MKQSYPITIAISICITASIFFPTDAAVSDQFPVVFVFCLSLSAYVFLLKATEINEQANKCLYQYASEF